MNEGTYFPPGSFLLLLPLPPAVAVGEGATATLFAQFRVSPSCLEERMSEWKRALMCCAPETTPHHQAFDHRLTEGQPVNQRQEGERCGGWGNRPSGGFCPGMTVPPRRKVLMPPEAAAFSSSA